MLTSIKAIRYLGYSILLIILAVNSTLAEPYPNGGPSPADTIVERQFQSGTGMPVGKIQSVRGEAVIFHRDSVVAYRAITGLPVYEGDTLSTQKKSRVLGRLIGGSNFSLAPETTLSILKCNYNLERKAGMTLLFLKKGDAWFKVNQPDGLSSSDYRVQTATTFTTADDAEFVIEVKADATVITTFAESRLETTRTADPESYLFLSDLQRMVIPNELRTPTIETVLQADADALRTEFSVLPTSKIFASSAEKYQTELPEKDRKAEEDISGDDSL